MNEYYSSSDVEPQSSREMKEIDKARNVGIDDFGASTNPFEHATDALKARIFHGANRVEFSFFGTGKSQKNQYTPGTFGKRERRDMRELAAFNEVDTTTHATVGIQGLSGLDMQNQMFSDQRRKQAIDEIKRAIHFASDATTGGAVVFHTGEAPRYMHGRRWNGEEDIEFEMYPEEDERKVRYLADPYTKRLVGQISNNDRIAVPEIKIRNGEIDWLKERDGKPKKDDLLKDYDKIFEGQIPNYETDDKGNIQTKMLDYSQFEDWLGKMYRAQGKQLPKDHDEREKLVEKSFFFLQRMLDVQYNLYFGTGSEREYENLRDQRGKVMDALNYYEDLKKKVPEDQWWKHKRQVPDRHTGVFIPPETRDPVEYLERNLNEIDRRLQQSKEMALHGRRAAKEALEVVNRAERAEDFAMKETSRSMAELGVYAWQMTDRAHKKYKKGETNHDIKNPIYIAPENLFPEHYGSHPDELREIVNRGREAMKKELKSKYGITDAKKRDELAEQHIKATFDIGHANVWWKYFKSKPNENLDDKRKRFNNWLLKKTKKMVKDGTIGHIHVSDNFGFHDEHLAAGDGTAPIKEFIENAKKEGLSDFIVETGSLNPNTALPDTWAHFDSPVYNLHMPGFTKNAWTDFHRSYFGRTEGPRYIVGDYAPSDAFKGAPFYSGNPLE